MSAKIIIGLLSIFCSQLTLANSNFLAEMLAKKAQPTVVKKSKSMPLSDPFFKNHAVVFFFSSQCTYCQQFSPVVKQWADAQSAPVLSLSFDNQPLSSFPDARPVTTQWINAAYAGKPITYPALFIANRQSYLLYPVAFGAMGYADLEIRLSHIKSKIEAYEAREKQA